MSDKIMTPGETRVAAQPAVAKQIAEINAQLAEGTIWFVVPTGIREQIRGHFSACGWKVDREQVNDNGWTVFYVSEEQEQ